MPEPDKTKTHPDQSMQNKPSWWHLYVIIAFALGFLGMAWAFSLSYIPVEMERVGSFLALSVNILILAAMFLQASITKRQWDAMQEGLGETRKLLDQNERLISTSKAQAKASERAVDFAENSFYRAERAYLYVRDVHPTYHPTAGKTPTPLVEDRDPKFAFEIRNGGRTPAFEVSAVVHTTVSNKPPEEVVSWTRSPETFGADFIMPNEAVGYTSGNNFAPPTGFNDPWSSVQPPDGSEDAWWDIDKRYYYIKINLKYWDIGGGKPNEGTFIYLYSGEKGCVLMGVDGNVFPHRHILKVEPARFNITFPDVTFTVTRAAENADEDTGGENPS